MTGAADVVVVGGGGVGSSVAYHLTARPDFSGSVVVVERDPTYATASTALSAGGVRQQFSTPENIRLSLYGARFIRELGRLLEVDGDKPDINFIEGGYLFLASPTGVSALEANHAVQKQEGADNALLDATALAQRFPWLNPEGVALGSLGLSMEGWFDPYGLLQALKRKARTQGARYVTDTVVGLERSGDRIVAVKLASGGRIAARWVVNAAGPQAGKLAAMAGLDLPVVPRKRFVYVFDCRETLEPRLPLLIDASGAWARPEGAGYIGGISPPEDQDPDSDDLDVSYDLWEETVWPTLAERIPAFETVKLQRAWAGHYDYNTLDQNGIIGPHPDVPNFLFANGFSGHGIQQAPATGRAIAELVCEGRFTTIDLARFGYERIRRREPLTELNVV
ncbi:MAG: FAD-binding oxidoreductase [Alphaproteobacteria bacterium]|nr:FAD-binding oxidoreductase [Alphaproteobacteria bacterium]